MSDHEPSEDVAAIASTPARSCYAAWRSWSLTPFGVALADGYRDAISMWPGLR
jgi:hypothetical protein